MEPPVATLPDRLPEAVEAAFPGRGTAPAAPPSQCGHCRHRIFGRGKIVQHLPPDKYRVNFTGFGLKVIMADYLTMGED